jgi:hypothetical protein
MGCWYSCGFILIITSITIMWKTIPSYPSYEASPKGCVRNKVTQRVLKPCTQKTGYLRLCLCRNGSKRTASVHCLILETFGGLRPTGLVCTHLNHNRSDNRLENLKWDTYSNNNKAGYRENGRKVVLPNVKGTQNPASKLTEEQVMLIRELASYGNKQTLLAKDFGVLPKTVSRIVNRNTWAHI